MVTKVIRSPDLSPHINMKIRGWNLEKGHEGHLHSLKGYRWTGQTWASRGQTQDCLAEFQGCPTQRKVTLSELSSKERSYIMKLWLPYGGKDLGQGPFAGDATAESPGLRLG